MTNGSGQAMTYQEKCEEALVFLAEGDPQDYPHITAEAETRGITAEAMADLVIAKRWEWKALSTTTSRAERLPSSRC